LSKKLIERKKQHLLRPLAESFRLTKNIERSIQDSERVSRLEEQIKQLQLELSNKNSLIEVRVKSRLANSVNVDKILSIIFIIGSETRLWRADTAVWRKSRGSRTGAKSSRRGS
jgi:uncharacterized protein (DUF1499 family)